MIENYNFFDSRQSLSALCNFKYIIVNARSCEANTTTMHASMIKRIILVQVQLCWLLHFPTPRGLEHHFQVHPAFLSLHYCII